MPDSIGDELEMHVAAVRQDDRHAACYIVIDESRTPVAFSGWTLNENQHIDAVEEAAVTALHQTASRIEADLIRIHSQHCPYWEVNDHIPTLENEIGMTIQQATDMNPYHEFARGIARHGAQSDISGWFTTTGPVTDSVTVYADGSERQQSGSTTAGYAVIDSTGKVLTASAVAIPNKSDYLAGEFSGLAQGLEAAQKFDGVSTVHAVTDNSRVEETINEDKDYPVRVAEEAVRVQSAIETIEDNGGTVTLTETNRQYNQLADALASYAHYDTFSTSIIQN